MEAVDILSDDGEDLSGALKVDGCMVGCVWPGVAKSFPAFELEIPVLDSRGFGAHEIVVINRLTPFPDALRPTEIRNPAASGNASASKDDYLLSFAQEFYEAIAVGWHITRLRLKGFGPKEKSWLCFHFCTLAFCATFPGHADTGAHSGADAGMGEGYVS